MNNKNIYILTGPIGSGKTTTLLNWSKNRNDIHGILTPCIMNKRVFMNAHSREQFSMEAKENEIATFSVGRYIFSRFAFQKASHIIQAAIKQKNWVIIDEIGPLELRNEGFAEVLKYTLASFNNEQDIILVVREELSEKVINNFQIHNAILITNIHEIRMICHE